MARAAGVPLRVGEIEVQLQLIGQLGANSLLQSDLTGTEAEMVGHGPSHRVLPWSIGMKFGTAAESP